LTYEPDAVLVIPADLPYLSVRDLDAMADGVADDWSSGVVAPSKDGGTGGLLLRANCLIDPAFGQDSAHRHEQRLRQSGRAPTILHRSGLAIDIDVPADLDLLGDQLLDVAWRADARDLDGPVHRPKQPRENFAGTDLKE